MTKPFGFGKAERLKSRKRIRTIFDDGYTYKKYPIIFFYKTRSIEEADGFPIRVGVSCSKRRFKRAVDRNRVKRLMREAYRLNKLLLLDPDGHHQLSMSVDIMMVYVGKDLPQLNDLHFSVSAFIRYLSKRISSQKIQ